MIQGLSGCIGMCRYVSGRVDQVAEPTWVKSSCSAGDGGQCAEVATAGPTVHVRDSRRPDVAGIGVPATQWTAFVRTAVRG
ncbi:DUF397 domain-containing protein [Streptomyces beigongshangae]|uniref:DUF397 domain-containing protein n=1 Tax=Streptomyces beigongshangae TaxID=2841597 RepID=UPI0027E0A145|nr:DUF397 domain-containing protein [Streptomyces sp. REN17]